MPQARNSRSASTAIKSFAQRVAVGLGLKPAEIARPGVPPSTCRYPRRFRPGHPDKGCGFEHRFGGFIERAEHGVVPGVENLARAGARRATSCRFTVV